jgi:membrane protease YdiL (CAAX protease family)
MPRVHAGPPGGRAVPLLTAVLVPVLAAWNNLLAPRLSPAGYTAVNATATAALVAAARAAGLSWPELGLDPRRLAAGARSGAVLAAPLAVGYGAGLALPPVRPLLGDARVAGLSGRRIAADVLVRIPVGTVLWEEVAFRGVLQAALGRLVRPRTGTAPAAALFGLWHVAPTLAALQAKDPAASPRTRWFAGLVGCTGTAAVGALFSSLRRRSGSLAAPAVLHLAANTLGLLAAAAAHRLGRGCKSGAGPARPSR